MPSLEIQVATLVVAGLAVLATLVGIYVNAQGQNDLANKVRRYQVHDRDLEDFRSRFQIVSELTDALHKTKDSYIELSADSKHEPFDESSYEKLYASVNAGEREIERLRNHPDYQAALHYLPDEWPEGLEWKAEQILALREKWIVATEDLTVQANREDAGAQALDIGVQYGGLADITAWSFGFMDRQWRRGGR